ncbi:unnamed protein product (macronuclear) [Paramecium tetraurelia]|uniref:Transmembrane protein n=1 Tax=Paramecium tetraurelia TaxID=5888 RepID=A0EAM4_PARTE|nr:uncharacterized protein GSPATT00025075001 [Paramecium tetraurelia]CAK92341.1 unnamed protein product [Paramecium tetraurelia]|eukprot:XP_001459738.1 hypothetical protein (macronuclear) [Paramecium tetraurelia strain d4-2]
MYRIASILPLPFFLLFPLTILYMQIFQNSQSKNYHDIIFYVLLVFYLDKKIYWKILVSILILFISIKKISISTVFLQQQQYPQSLIISLLTFETMLIIHHACQNQYYLISIYEYKQNYSIANNFFKVLDQNVKIEGKISKFILPKQFCQLNLSLIMFEQHFILLSAILIGLYLRQVQSECEKRKLASHDLFFAKNNDSALIESDSEERFNFLENQIQSSFLILIQEDEKIISTQFVDSPNDNLDAEKWLCQLIQTINQYCISCTVSIYIDEEGNTYQKHEEDYFRLKIETSHSEECYQFYLEDNLEFLVFCRAKKFINIYSVNLLNEFKMERRRDKLLTLILQSRFWILSYILCIMY